MVFELDKVAGSADRVWGLQQNQPDPTTPVPGAPQITQDAPIDWSKKPFLERAVHDLGTTAKFIGGTVKEIFKPKNLFWELPKSIVSDLWTSTVKQTAWALTKGQQGESVIQSPLGKSWLGQQDSIALTWANLRNPGASQQQLRTMTDQIKKENPFLTYAPGPINSILNVMIGEGFIQRGLIIGATKFAPEALKGITPELQQAAFAARKFATVEDFTKAVQEGKATVPEGLKATDFYKQSTEAKTLKGVMAAVEPTNVIRGPLGTANKLLMKNELYAAAAESLADKVAAVNFIKLGQKALANKKSVFNYQLNRMFKAVQKEGGIKPEDFTGLIEGTTKQAFIRATGKAEISLAPEAKQTLEYLRDFFKGRISTLQENGIKVTENAWDRVIAPMKKSEIVARFPETVKMSLDDAVKFATENGMSADDINVGVNAMIKKMKEDPVYFNHIFENQLHWGDGFIPSALRKTKGGYRKQYSGVEGYMKDPKVVAQHYFATTERDIMTKNMVDDVLAGKVPFETYQPAKGKTILEQMANVPERLQDDFVLWKPDRVRFYSGEAGDVTYVGVTKKVPGVYVRKNVARQLNNTFDSFGMAEGIARKFFDPLIDTWRFSVLALSPRWYINNTIGNFTLNSLAGVTPLDYLRFTGQKVSDYAALEIKLQVEKGFVGAEKLAMRTGRVGRVLEKGGGFFYGINEKIENYFRGILYKKKAYEYANNIYRYGDNATYGRVADFTKKQDFESMLKGMAGREDNVAGIALASPKVQAKALDDVNKFLFDYGALSRNERAIMRRAVPFYSWYKNIFRLTAQTAYEAPHKLALMYRMYQTLGPISDPDLPEWVRNRVPIPLTFKDPVSGKNLPLFATVRSAIPFSDVLRIADISHPDNLISSLNPVFKVAAERIVRQKLYQGKPFSSPFYDPYTGISAIPKIDRKTGVKTMTYVEGPPLPSLLKHITDQYPSFVFLTDTIDYAKFGMNMSRYDTGEPIVDPSGQAKYPNSYAITLLKQWGLNLLPFDAVKYIQDQKSKEKSSEAFSEKKLRGIQQFELNQENSKKINDIIQEQSIYQPLFGD